MKCINYHSLSSPLILSKIKYKYPFWLPNKPSSTLQENSNIFSLVSLRTRALHSHIFLAATSPPTAGKLSVLLQTSAVCLFAYWIANFVVPEMILKDLQAKKKDENGENSSEDEL